MARVLYRHKQVAYRLGWFFVLLTLGVLSTTFVLPEAPPLPFLALLLLSSLLFYTFTTLTVEVDAERVRVGFGLGLLADAFSVDDIVSCRRVQVPLWQGLGLRVSLDGSRWLYRIWGERGVQLVLRSGRQITLVTDEPEALHRALLRAMYTP